MVDIVYTGPYDRVWEETQREMELSASDFARRVEDLGGSYGTIVVDVRQYVLRRSSQDMVIMGTYDPGSEQMFLLFSSDQTYQVNLNEIDRSIPNSNIESLCFALLKIGTRVDKPFLEKICEGHIS